MSDKKWNEPKGKPSFRNTKEVDTIAGDKLQLFIENDADIYRQRLQPIQKILLEKNIMVFTITKKLLREWCTL